MNWTFAYVLNTLLPCVVEEVEKGREVTLLARYVAV